MKPSQNKCTNEHDKFVLAITSIYKPEDYDMYDFEKPIVDRTYIGTPDLFISTKPEATTEEERLNFYRIGMPIKFKVDIKIIEFKPEIISITEVARQLKVYQKYYRALYQYNGNQDRLVNNIELIFCTYEDLINEETKKICKLLGITIIGIKPKFHGLSQW